MSAASNAAPVTISAFRWVPPFARGYVRDYRVRWALAEAGVPYAVRKLDPRVERPQDYLAEQPFGQVPTYRDGSVALFESGAIVLHVGQACPALLPADPAGRARATAWAFAALNSIEPFLMELAAIDLFHPGEGWTVERRPQVIGMIEGRLDRLAGWIGGRDWLEDRFTAGDLLMASVLRLLDHTDLVEARPVLAAYKARCLARPAFRQAVAAQLADFEDEEPAAA